MHSEFHAFTITAADHAAVFGKLKRWVETRGATALIVSVTFTSERDSDAVTAVVVHTDSDASGIRAILVDGTPRSSVDVTDLMPAIREIVADTLQRGVPLRREALLSDLRARGLSVGGRRRKAADLAAKRVRTELMAARFDRATGQ